VVYKCDDSCKFLQDKQTRPTTHIPAQARSIASRGHVDTR